MSRSEEHPLFPSVTPFLLPGFHPLRVCYVQRSAACTTFSTTGPLKLLVFSHDLITSRGCTCHPCKYSETCLRSSSQLQVHLSHFIQVSTWLCWHPPNSGSPQTNSVFPHGQLLLYLPSWPLSLLKAHMPSRPLHSGLISHHA